MHALWLLKVIWKIQVISYLFMRYEYAAQHQSISYKSVQLQHPFRVPLCLPRHFCLLSFHLCFWFPTGKMQRRNHTQIFVLVLRKNLVNNNSATTKSLKSWGVTLKERFWFNKKEKKIESSLNDENYIVLSRQAFQIFQIVLPLSFLDKRCWDWLLVGSALQLFWLCLQCNIHPKKMHQLK